MSQTADLQLTRLINSKIDQTLDKCQVGLEKECLRVNTEGSISQTPHPRVLGSALTHPYITTDYSEALLELITPPMSDVDQALSFLCDTQKFVYDNLAEELLWATSMPCVVAGETGLPIAEYGTSNQGTMKHVYRRGLGYRYGHVMQVIAGVHFNFSFPDNFWEAYQVLQQSKQSHQEFIAESYFNLLRNLQRIGWVIPYLFGASPAVCKSFLNGADTNLHVFNKNTYYLPYATSLRMGDIGYQNNKENEKGVRANYNSLPEYVNSLKYAMETNCLEYEKIGIKVNGEYRQLNTNILQIENEYYSTVRPKQILKGNEKPIIALTKRGVQYVELRSLDVNAYNPTGVDTDQLYFLRALMLFCLLNDSPPILRHDEKAIDRNELNVAHAGRDSNMKLSCCDKQVSIKAWGMELCDQLQGCCEILDKFENGHPHVATLQQQREKFHEPDITPSAVMLADMRQHQEGFYHFAKRMSQQHQEYFNRYILADEIRQKYINLAESSLQQQQILETGNEESFEDYLQAYFMQN